MDIGLRMTELAEKLNAASKAYYNGEEIMSNFEYDRLFDELSALEKETGIVLENSPTRNVGAPVLDSLAKSVHEYPALSLDKTKDMELFVRKLSEHERKAGEAGGSCPGIVLMWKMDGSTVQLTYRGGALLKAVTRGNGEVGSVITHNAKNIKGIPMSVPFDGELVVRGEAVMSYTEFSRINSALPAEEQYANPRNLANATISMLDAGEAAGREIRFFAFGLVHASAPVSDSFAAKLEFLKAQGFGVVPFEKCTPDALGSSMERWEGSVEAFDFPVDGLVAAIDDTAYAASMPGTGHNPHISAGFAFKWKDDTAETVLREIEWSSGRTGVLTPVAIFDPVELEGTSVSRASLHNVSTLLRLDLKPGDRIEVFKANKIIPQVASNRNKEAEWDGALPGETAFERNALIRRCPVCGGEVSNHFTVSAGGVTDTLIAECRNPLCRAKLLGRFENFVGRDCMNIDGLSTATLEKLIGLGFIREYADVFHLGDPENSIVTDELLKLDGFGKKSVSKLLDSIEKSRETDFVSFLQALGIPNIGKGQAKLLKNYLAAEFPKAHGITSQISFVEALRILVSEGFDFTRIDGFGDVLAESLRSYLKKNLLPEGEEPADTELTRLLREVKFTDRWPESGKSDGASLSVQSAVAGKTFVITGKLIHYTNREELQNFIESLGGRTAGSVSKNTDYLINNDLESTSGKNKKAAELGIPVISEDDFIAMAKG